MIDNTELIKQLLVFNQDYYKFACIVRPKDNSVALNREANHEVCVHQWLIQSLDEYTHYLPDMLTYASLFKCRIYMTVDSKSKIKTLMQIRSKAQELLDQTMLGQTQLSCGSIQKIVNSATSLKECSGKTKRWLFDVDTKDRHVLSTVINACKDSYICTIETVNGYHVIARKDFNARVLAFSMKNVELKENAMTLVAKY